MRIDHLPPLHGPILDICGLLVAKRLQILFQWWLFSIFQGRCVNHRFCVHYISFFVHGKWSQDLDPGSTYNTWWNPVQLSKFMQLCQYWTSQFCCQEPNFNKPLEMQQHKQSGEIRAASVLGNAISHWLPPFFSPNGGSGHKRSTSSLLQESGGRTVPAKGLCRVLILAFGSVC